jgi:hypothetical protein
MVPPGGAGTMSLSGWRLQAVPAMAMVMAQPASSVAMA